MLESPFNTPFTLHLSNTFRIQMTNNNKSLNFWNQNRSSVKFMGLTVDSGADLCKIFSRTCFSLRTAAPLLDLRDDDDGVRFVSFRHVGSSDVRRIFVFTPLFEEGFFSNNETSSSIKLLCRSIPRTRAPNLTLFIHL